jgi:hypothetical protein
VRAREPELHSPIQQVLSVQRSAGNRVATVLLQRTPQADGTITDPAELARSRPVGGAVDVETRVRPMEALLATPRTKTVLDAIVRLRGDLNFPIVWSARGSFHRSGAIHLDRSKNETIWMEALAHELVHLCTFLAGRAADVSTMGREEFVAAKMTDEINAHAVAYVAQLQMSRTSSTSAGYNEFFRLLGRRHADLLRRQDWPAIEALAKTFVKGKYDDEWVGSKTGLNYYDKWRQIWDEAHPATE